MATPRWTPLSYTKNSKIPLEGEIILLRYPFSNINFHYGPASVYSSHATTAFSTTVSNNLWGVGPDSIHRVLILSVTHDREYKMINLTFMPIMTYSTFIRNGDPWMSREATAVQQLYHLPIPTAWWIPTPPIYSEAPVLSFGSWVNDRRAWLGMVTVGHDIHESQQWCRHPAGPVILDGDVSRLAVFLVLGIPAGLREIRTAAARARAIAVAAITTNNNAATASSLTTGTPTTDTAITGVSNPDTGVMDSTPLAGTTSLPTGLVTTVTTAMLTAENDTISTITAHSTGITTPAGTTTTTLEGTIITQAHNMGVHNVILPENYNVWAEIYGNNCHGLYDADTLGRMESENPITDDEIDRAMLGDDDIDPVAFWNFPGSPKALLEISQAHEKQMLDNRIHEWCAGGTVDVGEVYDEEDSWDGQEIDFEDDEIAFGEEACSGE